MPSKKPLTVLSILFLVLTLSKQAFAAAVLFDTGDNSIGEPPPQPTNLTVSDNSTTPVFSFTDPNPTPAFSGLSRQYFMRVLDLDPELPFLERYRSAFQTTPVFTIPSGVMIAGRGFLLEAISIDVPPLPGLFSFNSINFTPSAEPEQSLKAMIGDTPLTEVEMINGAASIRLVGAYPDENGNLNFVIETCQECPGPARVSFIPDADPSTGVWQIKVTDALITAKSPGILTLTFSHIISDFTVPVGFYPYEAFIRGTFLVADENVLGQRIKITGVANADVINTLPPPPRADVAPSFDRQVTDAGFIDFDFRRREGAVPVDIFCPEGMVGGQCSPALSVTLELTFKNAGDGIDLRESAGITGTRKPGPEGQADLDAFNRGPVINDLVIFDPLEETFRTTSDVTGCPRGFAGKLSFDARLMNTSPPSGPTLSDLRTRVTTLTNGNILQTLGGVGAELRIPGVLSSGQFVDVPFNICLTGFEPFDFLVNVLGVSNAVP